MIKKNDYTKTPSFYNSDEVFMKYLGKTSYYLSLQPAVSKIVSLSKPNKLIDIGFGTGSTTVRLSEENPHSSIKAIDMREDMVKLLSSKAKDLGLNNIETICDDMCHYINKSTEIHDAIIMVYSFHHICDPLHKKNKFLMDCYNKLNTKGIIIIGETFIPEEADSLTDTQTLANLWKLREEEAYGATFWNTLMGLDEDSIEFCRNVANFSKHYETKAGELVSIRSDEYLVKKSWLVYNAERIGFSILINESINCVGESVIVLKK